MSDRVRGVLLLLSAALLWSFGGLWIKLIGLHWMAIAGGRSFFAAILIWFYVRGSGMRFSRQLVLGALAYAGTVLLFVASTKLTTAANAILLQYTAPAYVALLSAPMLGERITRLDWLTILFVFAGMVLFFFDGLATGSMLGNGLAALSGVFFALCVLFLRMGREGGSLGMILVGNLITAAIGLPFIIGQSVTGTDVLFLLLLGVLQLGLGYLAFAKGVRHVAAIEAILIPVMEPILNPLWVAAFYGERPSLLSIVGGVVVVASVTARGVLNVSSRHSNSKRSNSERSNSQPQTFQRPNSP